MTHNFNPEPFAVDVAAAGDITGTEYAVVLRLSSPVLSCLQAQTYFESQAHVVFRTGEAGSVRVHRIVRAVPYALGSRA